MESRRRITEEDLLVTEALIAESYGRLKKSVVQAPSRALGSVGGTISRHPFAAAATAIVGGIAAYVIITRMTSHGAVAGQKRERNHPDMMKEILLMLLPLAAPHIASYIQKYIGSVLSAESR
jgi:O-antigen/teichoic acid export membrane protein